VLEGTELTTDDIEEAQSRISNNQVPEVWVNASYVSNKTLASYYNDFLKRVDFFMKWIENGNYQSLSH
jgi:hypothetical protein